MIGSFFSVSGDSRIFEKLNVANQYDSGGKKNERYKKHMNRHNVIFIDFSKAVDGCGSYEGYISMITEILREDLHDAYPQVRFRPDGSAWEDLQRIAENTGQRFIFIFDEWDFIFHRDFVTDKDKKSYIAFLSTLLKDQPYVELAYITGILPIAKYSSGPELNMFAEYTMNTQHLFSGYFGFTETEVHELFGRYLEHTPDPIVTLEGIRLWYDGYYTLAGERLYNPRSVVLALCNNRLADYWTSSGPYDEIFYYVKNNIADVRDDIAVMIAGEPVPAEVQEYSVTSCGTKTRSEILSAMVVYGFLTCSGGKVSIPNRELMNKFVHMVRKESSLGYIYRLARESERMLAATKAGDTETMASILKQAHDTETGMQGYNDETELSAVIKLVYLAARDYYDIQREDKAGVGYVDYIFYPVTDMWDDCIILELKVNHTAVEAIQQVKDRGYAQRFIGKIGEELPYRGRILAVGIAYFKDDKNKQHECKVEVLRGRAHSSFQALPPIPGKPSVCLCGAVQQSGQSVRYRTVHPAYCRQAYSYVSHPPRICGANYLLPSCPRQSILGCNGNGQQDFQHLLDMVSDRCGIRQI